MEQRGLPDSCTHNQPETGLSNCALCEDSLSIQRRPPDSLGELSEGYYSHYYYGQGKQLAPILKGLGQEILAEGIGALDAFSVDALIWVGSECIK